MFENGGLLCYWSKFNMNEIYQVHDTHGCPKIADNIYCFQLFSPEPVMWRASPPFDVARPNWRPFNSPNTYRAPLLTFKPQLVTYPTGRLRTWPPQCYSEADECWRVSSPPRTKFKRPMDLCLQQYPPWFVDMGSYHRRHAAATASFILSSGWRLFYISPVGESSPSKRRIENLLVLLIIGHPISFPHICS